MCVCAPEVVHAYAHPRWEGSREEREGRVYVRVPEVVHAYAHEDAVRGEGAEEQLAGQGGGGVRPVLPRLVDQRAHLGRERGIPGGEREGGEGASRAT